MNIQWRMEMKASRMSMIRGLTIIGVCLSVGLPGCGPESGRTPAFGWQVGGCKGMEQALTRDEGFMEDCKPETLLPTEVDLCTETLYWKYDQDTQVLQLVDFPASLNCCGIRSVQHEFLEGVYLITEIDEPGEYRCRCMCDTSFSVCLADIPEGAIQIRLLRHVTDDDQGPVLVWEGELNLSTSQGQIAIGPSNSIHCVQ